MKHDIQFFEDEHLYLVNGTPTPSVTEILSAITSRGYSKVNPSVLEYAANRGKATHEALQLLDYDADRIRAVKKGLDFYLDSIDQHLITVREIEKIIYDHTELEMVKR